MDDAIQHDPSPEMPDQPSDTPPPSQSQPSFLAMPTTIEETGLDEGFLLDLLPKVLYTVGSLSGYQLTDRLKLATTVVNALLVNLKKERLIMESTGAGSHPLEFINTLTSEGTQRVRESMGTSMYAGPCPVPLEVYSEAVKAQSIRGRPKLVDRARLEEGLAHLVVDEELIELIGPAINSWRSLFIYGPAGGGKTVIAKAIGNMISEEYYLPHAIAVDGQVIKLFDPVNHVSLDPPGVDVAEAPGGDRPAADPRWLRCQRPVVTTGGELTLEMLDLAFNPLVKYYEAPLQLKANGGMFLVDDFGRQLVSPRDLLNRWIIPMEERRDYLTLHTGQKFPVPFDILTIFGTNIEPRDLVDEAFLRRIPFKVEVKDPRPDQFHSIFDRVCEERELEYDKDVVEGLLERFYRAQDKPLRACHPRDLVEIIVARAAFLKKPPRLTEQTLAEAWKTYFVD